MRSSGLLVVFLVLLLAGCTMPWARGAEPTHEIVVSQPTPQIPHDGDGGYARPTQELDHHDDGVVLVPGADDGLLTLTVEEWPIVAAEIDGPGHFEYTDRLGEGILTRIKGLRTRAVTWDLAAANAALAPFGYRLGERFDAEWNRTFYDLYRQGKVEPVLPELSRLWPVSVNASGTDFILAAENAPNVLPLYLQVQVGGIEAWDAEQSAFLPPAYVGDALAQVTFTGFPTLTYQVELDGRSVYSGTAAAMGASMPLRSFTTWDGHWALEVDDHLIVDGQDVGQASGYDAAFGFSLIRDQPFYFFEQEGRVRISYGGQTLPNAYPMERHVVRGRGRRVRWGDVRHLPLHRPRGLDLPLSDALGPDR
jgi:hypothetical protein